jgi:hypothetical protein
MKGILAHAIVIALASLGAALAYSDDMVRQSNGIPYLSGGVGLDSREALQAKAGDYNLMVILAVADGHYLGGAALTIRDRTGKTVLDIEAQGPWTLTKLAPGAYTVDAKTGGATRSGRVTIGTKGLKRVRLIWDKEPA